MITTIDDRNYCVYYILINDPDPIYSTHGRILFVIHGGIDELL